MLSSVLQTENKNPGLLIICRVDQKPVFFG